MASADMAPPGRQQPPAYLNLSSNNPFRNRLSVQASSPRSMEETSPQFPFPAASKNPFLDPQDAPVNKGSVDNNTAEVEDIFRNMAVSENGRPAFSNGPLPPPNGAPARSGTLPQTQQRPLGAEERRDRPPRPYAPRGPDSPQKRPTEHRRRASESSMMDYDKRERSDRRIDRGERPTRTESEERRRRERRREREERYKREGKELPPSSSRSRKMRNLDLIDKLDVTGVYGHGLFHHDGPFDACNPSRNAKKDRRAPMQAFPEGSANMALGGSGPNRSRLDLDKFHGRTEEGFNDFSTTRKADTSYREPERPTRGEPQYFNPTERTEQVHGPESYGLGTSTFLEGAPASKSALQRRESEEKGASADGYGGGLQRKKSLAQRLRGMSNSRPRNGSAIETGRSPEPRYNGGPVELTDNPAPQPKIPATTSGPSRVVYTRENEVNVFDTEYDKAFEKKGAEIRWAEQERPSESAGQPRASSGSGSNGLYRSVTADAAMPSPSEEKPTGFLNRMKSLKGGPRKPRMERKDSSS